MSLLPDPYWEKEDPTDPDYFPVEENHNEAYQRYADKMKAANDAIAKRAQDRRLNYEFHQDMHPYQDSEPVFPKLPPWNTYQHHVENFINPNVKNASTIHRCLIAALGLCSESGEVADHIKKHIEQGHPFNLDKVCEKLGDVLFYVAAMCNANNLSMDEVMDANVKKLTARYPSGFSTEASINRTK